MTKELILNKHKISVCVTLRLLTLLHLEFCTAAWSPHYVKDKELLEKVQRQFTRMIPGLKDVPYNERLQNCTDIGSLVTGGKANTF